MRINRITSSHYISVSSSSRRCTRHTPLHLSKPPIVSHSRCITHARTRWIAAGGKSSPRADGRNERETSGSMRNDTRQGKRSPRDRSRRPRRSSPSFPLPPGRSAGSVSFGERRAFPRMRTFADRALAHCIPREAERARDRGRLGGASVRKHVGSMINSSWRSSRSTRARTRVSPNALTSHSRRSGNNNDRSMDRSGA